MIRAGRRSALRCRDREAELAARSSPRKRRPWIEPVLGKELGDGLGLTLRGIVQGSTDSAGGSFRRHGFRGRETAAATSRRSTRSRRSESSYKARGSSTSRSSRAGSSTSPSWGPTWASSRRTATGCAQTNPVGVSGRGGSGSTTNSYRQSSTSAPSSSATSRRSSSSGTSAPCDRAPGSTAPSGLHTSRFFLELPEPPAHESPPRTSAPPD